jgi:hypothetical protein
MRETKRFTVWKLQNVSSRIPSKRLREIEKKSQ